MVTRVPSMCASRVVWVGEACWAWFAFCWECLVRKPRSLEVDYFVLVGSQGDQRVHETIFQGFADLL